MLKSLQAVAFSAFFLGISLNLLGQGYQVVSIANGGTISGTVKWAGAMPHMAILAITKDPQICDPESHKVRDLERLIVGEQGGVANTVVFLKDISRGKAMDIPPQRRFLDQRHCRYEPHILLVPASGTLQMKSSDAVLHTVHMDGAATYNLPFPFPNQVISRDMPAVGRVNLTCNAGPTCVHPTIPTVSYPHHA